MQKEKPFNLKSKLRRSVTSIQDHNKNRFLIQTIDEAGKKMKKKILAVLALQLAQKST